jgi:membrane protein
MAVIVAIRGVAVAHGAFGVLAGSARAVLWAGRRLPCWGGCHLEAYELVNGMIRGKVGGGDMAGESVSRPTRGWSGGWRARWDRNVLGQTWRGGSELELLRRSMAFSAQGLVTLVPLLIVVAAIDPFPDRGFGEWVADGMSLPAHSAMPVVQLFATQHEAAKAAGVISLALLAVFGLAFVGDVQKAYEKIWGLPAQAWHQSWRQAAWLAALTGYVMLDVESGSLLRHGMGESVQRILLLGASGFVFFWWGQHFLLGGRVHWMALLPGAAATIFGLGGLRAFSALVFDGMVASNAETYGAVGIVLVVVSWLIGVGFVIYGGALLGRHFAARHGATVATAADSWRSRGSVLRRRFQRRTYWQGRSP